MGLEDIQRIQFQIGKFESIEIHPDADNLRVCQVRFRNDVRTVVMSKLEYEEKLLLKHSIFVTNLKPAKIRNVESTAMILAAKSDGGASPFFAEDGEVGLDGVEFQPDGMLKSKGALKAWDRVK